MQQPKRHIRFRLATNEDQHLETYDNTKLVAINTCPTWGVLRYAMHKQMPGSGRALALECGSAMHEVFAWVRLCTFTKQLEGKHSAAAIEDAYYHHGHRLFGSDRFTDIVATIPNEEEDYVQRCKMGAIAVLETGTYYDDSRDRRRTVSNMIEASLGYIDRWRWNDPIWMRDVNDPLGDIGIEIPFDIVVTAILGAPGEACIEKQFRLTGKIDGIRVKDGVVTLEENKTASRLGDAWSMAFAMSSQVTGYCIAGSVFTEGQVRNADILGITIPLPKNYDYGGIVREPVSRQDFHFTQWVEWLLHSVEMYEQWKGNPYDAPKYTHSCNRYFRPCSFLPFCDSTKEDQLVTVSEMVDEEWSPLKEVGVDD